MTGPRGQGPVRLSAIARSLLVRQAAEVLMPDAPDAVGPALEAVVLDPLCDLLGLEGGRPDPPLPSQDG